MHKVCQYRTALPGVEAVSLISDRQFSRHSHDQFGIGIINSGGHHSWSGIGWVDAVCGDIIMVNPGEMHDGSPIGKKPRSWKMLFFEPQIACEVLAGERLSHQPDLLPTVRDRDLAMCFRRLFDAVIDQQPDTLLIDEVLVRTLAHTFRHHGSTDALPRPGLPCVDRIVKLIDGEPERAFSLREMANIAGVSRFHFLRAFSRATGATPHAYILQRRVRLVRRLLKAGWDLGEASAHSGFADQSHMTRAFVRQLGTTPAHYRQVVRDPRGRAISFKTAASRH